MRQGEQIVVQCDDKSTRALRRQDSTQTTAEKHWISFSGRNVMCVSETRKRRESGEIDDHVVGRQVESHEV